MNRRVFLGRAIGASITSALVETVSHAAVIHATQARIAGRQEVPAGVAAQIDRESASFMRAMNSPGISFALTSLKGHEYIAGYGYEVLETQKPLDPARLFQIGSISKSMGAVLCMQLVDEGKLDLAKPVMEYLPWLPWETPHGAVTMHHVLTHSSGLPNGGPLFFADPAARHVQRNAPGARYYYSNMAFNVIGHLVEHFDKRSYQASLVERLFKPCGMEHTRSQLGGTEWNLQAESYIPAEQDRPFMRFGPLRTAPQFHEQTSAGCVASTAADMAMYMRMLLRKGVADSGRRVVSEASLQKMFTRHIATDEFSEGGAYGYGIAVGEDAGDTVLLHTGGMVSFMSAIHLNVSRGIGAFASVNAQQGYRPVLVTQYAARALRKAMDASASEAAAISVPAVDHSKNAVRFAGEYVAASGVKVEIVAEGERLLLRSGNRTAPLEIYGNRLLTSDAELGADRWKVVSEGDHILGLMFGFDFYVRKGAALPATKSVPDAWQAHVGDYVNDDPWEGSARVTLAMGKLYVSGTLLEDAGDGSFYVMEEELCPDRVRFACTVNGKSQILIFNGTQMRRYNPA